MPFTDRLRSAGVQTATGLANALPERLLLAAAEAAGELWYRVAPARAAQARRNLGRATRAMAARGRGTPLARRAASDPAALERLVRAAFRHAARYYVELARSRRMDERFLQSRLVVETPDAVRAAVGSETGIILVGLHFGSLELPALYLTSRGSRPITAPMEEVSDPALRAWFEQTRRHSGIRIIPIANARRELLRALRRGESAGLVADRDMTGSGVLVPFFGVPARLPVGPALLALETGSPVFVGGARRRRDGRYAARLIGVDAPETGSRRDRVVELTTRIAAAFESLIADAPEQWWACFHPIWADLEAFESGVREAA